MNQFIKNTSGDFTMAVPTHFTNLITIKKLEDPLSGIISLYRSGSGHKIVIWEKDGQAFVLSPKVKPANQSYLTTKLGSNKKVFPFVDFSYVSKSTKAKNTGSTQNEGQLDEKIVMFGQSVTFHMNDRSQSTTVFLEFDETFDLTPCGSKGALAPA